MQTNLPANSRAQLAPIILALTFCLFFQAGCDHIFNKPQDVTIRPGQKRAVVCDRDSLQENLHFGYLEVDCKWEAVDLSDPPPSPVGLPFYAAAVRQADCSLTRFVLDSSFNLQPQETVPNYQAFLDISAGIKASPDQFKNGCKDTRTGRASQTAAELGPLANGNYVYADITGDGVGVRVITPFGGIVSITDYPAYSPSSNPSANTFSLEAVDLNGDGNEDLVLVSSGFTGGNPGLISVYLGNGDGTFQNAVNVPVVVPATGMVVDDVTGDGKLDLVVVGQTLFNGGPGLEVLPGNGNATFGTPIVSGVPNVEALAAVSADFNNDGKKDVALSTGQILLGDGAGNFALQAQVLPTLATGTIHGNPNFATGIAAGDFNHDGNVDLAVTNAVSLTVDLYFGKGDGTFTYQASYASLYSHQNIQTTDIDGDGSPDLFVGTASGGGFGSDYNTAGMFLSLLNTGAGKMSGAAAYLPKQPALQFPVLYDVGDFNDDGKTDLVTMDADSGNSTPVLSVLTGNSDGTFSPGPQTPVIIAGLASLQGKLSALVAADFDGDGKIDAAFAYTDQGGKNRISVALGNGDGTFKPQSDFSVPGSVVSLVVADLNGDTKPDIAFVENSKADGSTTGTGIFVLLNTTTTVGTATFQAAQQIDLQPNLGFLTVHDLGNGKQDLIATSGNIATTSTENTLFVYLGNGDGTFRTPTMLSGGAFPGPVGVADMNNDGKLDLIVAATNSDGATGTLTVLPGSGDGTFGAGVITQISQGLATSIAVADYAKNGNQAVVLGACCGETYTFVAGGNGDGTFAAEGQGTGILPLGVSSNLIKLIDLNGDGFLDMILVSNQYSIEVFRNLNTTPPLPQSTTALSLSASSIVQGQPVSFTARVVPVSGGATPAGSIIFVDGAQNLATVAVDGSGQANFTTTSLAVGLHPVAAFFDGGTHFGSSSGSGTVSVSSASLTDTTTTLAGPSSATAGASMTFTATVAPASGMAKPTGTVTFLDGTKSFGTGSLNASGVATLSTTTLAAGNHSITARYGGNTNFNASTSSALSLTIDSASLVATTAALTGPATANVGTSVTFGATVTPASGTSTPTGTVNFFDGTTTLGTGTLNGSRIASLSTSALAIGSHSITAKYSGDASFAASTSSPLTLTIAGPDFQIAASPTNLAIKAGQAGNVTFTITPVNGSTQTVNLSCGTLPANTTCSFAPSASVTLDGAKAGSSTLTIQTAANSATLPVTNLRGRHSPTLIVVLLLVAILLFYLTMRNSGWYRLLRAFCAIVALFACVLGIVACGGSGKRGTLPGTYNLLITATATSGGSTHPANVSITIN